jgi:tRNA dimethylallyltransferase
MREAVNIWLTMGKEHQNDKGDVLIIAGATASGKSAVALRLAEQRNGLILNADSMQVYEGLPILSAQPVPGDPHRLYGVLKAFERCSAARWRTMVTAEINRALEAAKLPIVVGGTGLYIKALTEGLSPIPEIDEGHAQAWYTERNDWTAADFRTALTKVDPVLAGQLKDRQRLARALLVGQVTGTPLSVWQKTPPPPVPYTFHKQWLTMPRGALHARIAQRLEAMFIAGVLDEVAAFTKRGLDPALPIMKTLGLAALQNYLQGLLSLEEAKHRILTTTRQYAKRQETWFRHQYKGEAMCPM